MPRSTSEILKEFERLCRGKGNDLKRFIESLDAQSLTSATTIALIEWDVQNRVGHNKTVNPSDYQWLGDDAVRFASDAIAGLDQTIAPSSSPFPPNDATIAPSTSPDAKTENGSTNTPTGTKTFAHFELIEELARGGMGVVYRARDTKLNRIVALKMVISGRLASEEERLRFNLEAEAAAKLDHSAITPIYEVGEADGQQYFAMKMIEGGSLEDRLSELTRDPSKAARIVAEIARGIHHAHQRGTLHRDLKPQNILMDVDEKPMITDFGLAKLSDADSHMTQTGAVMGTPGYMPPEQALGDKNITTAADIYSLGAILFATLTGRPPFDESTAMETVLQVIDGEAPKPTSINTRAPMDLELIAPKCLERDPTKRYATAAEVADDLERWLAGEPISVRVPSVASQARQWLKRNIRMAALSLISGCVIAAIGVPLVLVGFQQSGLPGSIYQEIPQTAPPIFAGLDFGLPDELSDLPRFLMLVTAITLISSAGMISVALLRPKTMNEAVGIGIMSGIAVATTLFLLFFGWMISGHATANHISADTALLYRTISTDDAARDLAYDKIAWRYPDLSGMERKDQTAFLFDKIQDDTVLMTGLGNILAATVSLMFFVPVVFAAAFYFRLIENDWSLGWRLLGHFEFILIGVMMSLALVWMLVTIFLEWLPAGMLNGPKPGVLMLLMSVAVSAVAFWAIWSFKSLWVKLATNAIAIGLFVYVVSTVFAGGNVDQEFLQHIRNENYLAAAKRHNLQTYQGGIWLGSAAFSVVLSAYAEDWEHHRQYRSRFIQNLKRREYNYGETSLPYMLESILTSPLSDQELAQTYRMTEFVSRFATSDPENHFANFVLALAAYRRGDLDTALVELNKIPVESQIEKYTSFETQPSSHYLDDQKSFLLRAMIFFEKGKTQESSDEMKKFESARKFLSEVWYPQYITEGKGKDNYSSMSNAYFVMLVLEREAKELMGK